MALTAQQMATLNQLLSKYPSTSTHPNLLAEMFELLAPSFPAIVAQWRSETLSQVQSQQAIVTQPFTDAQSAINGS